MAIAPYTCEPTAIGFGFRLENNRMQHYDFKLFYLPLPILL